MLLPSEQTASAQQMEKFLVIRQAVVQEAFALFDERGKDHDVAGPYWHRCPFGDITFAQMCFETAGRLVSAVQKIAQGRELSTGTLEDRLLDMINWAVMWLSWRRMRSEGVLNEHDAQPVHPLKDNTRYV